MERGQMVGNLRARFGDRLTVGKGGATIDTNGDDIQIFFNEETQVFHLDGTIVELGSGQHVSYKFEDLNDAMDAIDRLIAIEGPMPSVPEADLVVAAPAIERLEALASVAPAAAVEAPETPLVVG